jgi:3-deoxy-7-phosphoheptulonate synthase
VLDTIETFPRVVFAGEARHLEERLAEATMGRAFILQGGGAADAGSAGGRRAKAQS